IAPETISEALADLALTSMASLKSYGSAIEGTTSVFSGTLRPRSVTTFNPGWRNRELVWTAAVNSPPGLSRRSRTRPAGLRPRQLEIVGLGDRADHLGLLGHVAAA